MDKGELEAEKSVQMNDNTIWFTLKNRLVCSHSMYSSNCMGIVPTYGSSYHRGRDCKLADATCMDKFSKFQLLIDFLRLTLLL